MGFVYVCMCVCGVFSWERVGGERERVTRAPCTSKGRGQLLPACERHRGSARQREKFGAGRGKGDQGAKSEGEGMCTVLTC
jgi:hypothetical protein